jgi:alpha-tubulin suppressor-like RCC1 family protein
MIRGGIFFARIVFPLHSGGKYKYTGVSTSDITRINEELVYTSYSIPGTYSNCIYKGYAATIRNRNRTISDTFNILVVHWKFSALRETRARTPMQCWVNNVDFGNTTAEENTDDEEENGCIAQNEIDPFIRSILWSTVETSVTSSVVANVPIYISGEYPSQWLSRIQQLVHFHGSLIPFTVHDLVEVVKAHYKHIWVREYAAQFGDILKVLKKAKKFKIKYINDYAGTVTGVNHNTRASSLFRSFSIFHVRQVAFGGSHYVFLTTDGTLYGGGGNSLGQLGCKSPSENCYLTSFALSSHSSYPVAETDVVDSIACGFSATFLVARSGVAYAAGCLDNGRLGVGLLSRNTHYPQWYRLLGPPFRCIYGGSVSGCGISTDHFLFSWGKAKYNGHTTTDDLLYPRCLSKLGRVLSASMSGGGYHTVALTASGTVWVWGHNRVGQLSIGHNFNAGEDYESVFERNRKMDDHVVSFPIQWIDWKPFSILYVLAGWGNTMVIDSKNRILICGRNCSGQLGIEPCTEAGRTPCQKEFVQLCLYHNKIYNISLTSQGVAIGDDSGTRLWGEWLVRKTPHTIEPSLMDRQYIWEQRGIVFYRD